MEETRKYEVLKLISHGQRSRIGRDCIEGMLLIHWVKYHPNVEKEQLFEFVRELIRQAEQFHRSKSDAYYQYINPYSIVVESGTKVRLLDLSAKSNEAILKNMQRRSIRTHFLPEESGYQTKNLETNLYSLGRTIQFLFSQININPPLSRNEERRFQRVIQTSLGAHPKKKYYHIHEIQKDIPIVKEKTEAGKRLKKVAAAAIVVVAAGVFFIVGKAGISGAPKISEQKEAEQSAGAKGGKAQEMHAKSGKSDSGKSNSPDAGIADTDSSDVVERNVAVQDKYILELGLVYFLEMENYEKSRDYFSEAAERNRMAENYVFLCDYMLDAKSHTEQEIEEVLKETEDRLQKITQSLQEAKEQGEFFEASKTNEAGGSAYLQSMMRVYARLSSERAKVQLIRLGEACFADALMQNDKLETDRKWELHQYMADAYEQTGEPAKAIGEYTALKELLSEKPDMENEKVEWMYQQMIRLYEQEGAVDEAINHCAEGIEKVPESKTIRLLHMRILCKDSGMDRAVCAQKIQDYLTEMPELQEDMEFKKLQQEYGITMEGGTVWVGK